LEEEGLNNLAGLISFPMVGAKELAREDFKLPKGRFGRLNRKLTTLI